MDMELGKRIHKEMQARGGESSGWGPHWPAHLCRHMSWVDPVNNPIRICSINEWVETDQ